MFDMWSRNANAKLTFVKQYGLSRSGTNYTRWLIEHNFENVRVLSNIFGHKHLPYSAENIKLPVDYWLNSEKVKTDLSHKEISEAKKQLLHGEMVHVVTIKPILHYLWSQENRQRLVGSIRQEKDSAKRSRGDTLLLRKTKSCKDNMYFKRTREEILLEKIETYNETNKNYIDKIPGPCIILNYHKIKRNWPTIREFFLLNGIMPKKIQLLENDEKFAGNTDTVTMKTVGKLENYQRFHANVFSDDLQKWAIELVEPDIASVLDKGCVTKLGRFRKMRPWAKALKSVWPLSGKPDSVAR